MSDERPLRDGAAHWGAKMLSSGRFAILQTCLAMFALLSVAGVVMLLSSSNERVEQAAVGLITFATAQISTAFGFYLRGGSTEQ